MTLAAVAGNEYRILTNRVVFLAILPDELEAVGVAAVQEDGRTSCAAVRPLHHNIDISPGEALGLCTILFTAGRSLATYGEGRMKKAVKLAQAMGCFAVAPDSRKCACGARR